MSLSDEKNVNDMYIKKDTLSTRIHLHKKYSTNNYGWHNWVFDQYNLIENMNILEFGSGPGTIWIGREEQIPENVNVILTDISPLMIEKSKEKLSSNNRFSFQEIDIQNVPFSDNSFDVIIANHMLYHVPNMEKALSEVKRILKNNGVFYTTTTGKNNLKELNDMYREYGTKEKLIYSDEISFTLENGEELLKQYFSKIEQRIYIDSLEVSEVNDLMDYIVSYNDIPNETYEKIYADIQNEINRTGRFKIRKEAGIFICKN